MTTEASSELDRSGRNPWDRRGRVLRHARFAAASGYAGQLADWSHPLRPWPGRVDGRNLRTDRTDADR
ncbi:MAG TPA: hypothetical protein VNS83_09865 [Lapillicoccus sp.]|nr:hypothetical protein [Lapillicoccus sp.]